MQIDQEFTDALMATDEGKALAEAGFAVRVSTATDEPVDDEEGRGYTARVRRLEMDAQGGVITTQMAIDKRLLAYCKLPDLELRECAGTLSHMRTIALADA